MNFLERFLAQGFFFSVSGLVHFNKPLLRGAENYRIVAAPAVRIAVLVFIIAKKSAALSEQFHDDGIGGEYVFAFVFGQTFEVEALVVERRIDLQAVLLAGIEVVGAVAGGSVNDAAALIEGDVISENAGHLNRKKWMLKFHTIEIAALEGGAHASFLDATFGLQSGDAVGG